MSELHSRFSGLFDIASAKEWPITVIGAGSIGSWLVRGLARTGFEAITVMDFDSVDEVNVLPQGYSLGDIGQHKVAALAKDVEQRLGVKINAVLDKFESPGQLQGPKYVVAAVDSIAARALIYRAVLETSEVELLLDPRMGARHGNIFATWTEDAEGLATYAKTLDPEGVSPLACSEKNTPFCGAGMAMTVTAYVASAFTGEQERRYQEYRCSYFNPNANLYPVG